jgi:hypothetical protein
MPANLYSTTTLREKLKDYEDPTSAKVNARLCNLEGALSKFNGRLVTPKFVSEGLYSVTIPQFPHEDPTKDGKEKFSNKFVELRLPERNFQVSELDQKPTIRLGPRRPSWFLKNNRRSLIQAPANSLNSAKTRQQAFVVFSSIIRKMIEHSSITAVRSAFISGVTNAAGITLVFVDMVVLCTYLIAQAYLT